MTTHAASRMSAASTSSRLIVPSRRASSRASSPPTIAPRLAPLPISPNSRRACRVSNVEVGERPRLHRRDDAEAVHPDVEDRRQARHLPEPERVPEPDHVQAEEDQRSRDDRPRPDARHEPRVERQADRQHDRHGDVDVDELVGAVRGQKQPVSNRLGQQERRHRQRHVQERQRDRAGPRRAGRRRTDEGQTRGKCTGTRKYRSTKDEVPRDERRGAEGWRLTADCLIG